MLYPMKFLPLYKDKIWGGNKIKDLGFNYAPLPNCGELWALSAVEGNESIIANGFLAENSLAEALEIYMGELIGEANYDRFGNQFPLLIKVIDANDRLSIQVHPDDTLAQQRGMDMGKTEMWYILQAEEGSTIVDGFTAKVTPEEYQNLLAQGKLEDILHVEHPQQGDVFFIPAGRVHALGKGLLLAEIQQTSDCTYRIYDYNRRDAQGNLRQLHTAETEKFAHVTFFLNGGREAAFPGEDRILIPSPKVATYDLKPEMSAYEVKDKLVEAIRKDEYDFIVVNFANGDMVGHTGIYEAIEKAVKAIDECVHDVIEAVKETGYEAVIIADHGNADNAINPDGSANTAHSLNPVPFIYITDNKAAHCDNGVLADVAPSILHIMGLDQPADMTGRCLIH
mgnify:CR=1 FL=1